MKSYFPVSCFIWIFSIQLQYIICFSDMHEFYHPNWLMNSSSCWLTWFLEWFLIALFSLSNLGKCGFPLRFTFWKKENGTPISQTTNLKILFSPIFSPLFLSWKWKQISYFSTKVFSSQFWAFEKIITNIGEKIGENRICSLIWWARYFFFKFVPFFLDIMHSKYNHEISNSQISN